jgi:hypothetical protein
VPPAAPPPAPEPWWPETRHVLGRAFDVMTLTSTWAAGALGAGVVWRFGPPLAMLVRMYLLEPEPVEPARRYPWLLAALLAALPLPLVLRRRWRLAAFAALPFALLPWWVLWTMLPETIPP